MAITGFYRNDMIAARYGLPCLAQHRSATFRHAPKDGTVVEVRHGRDQEIARAEWSGQNQGWVRVGDPHRKTLYRVTGWRPVGQG